MSPAEAAQLRTRLDSTLGPDVLRERVSADPVEFPRRYEDPRDVEVSGLLAASLAYGRADLFKPKVAGLLAQMGPSPASFVQSLDVPRAARLLDGFVYRFNVGTDVAVLLLGIGQALRTHGSLETLFVKSLEHSQGALHGALASFLAVLRDVPLAPLQKALGPERGLHHLLPVPLGAGAAKRLLMYLRWMVRGPDEVDLGIWRRVQPSQLLVPLDTHTGRMAQNLGLTRRKDLSWRTAEEVTAALRLLDPQDPVRYDFALCHFGMSGACPATPRAENCSRCSLLERCRVGPRILRRSRVKARR
ncbi:MAG: TIGR02757 family protein [Myxococcaceae bacterium]|nr:TIGR02757 family protein [Myxococcaceae bacterium]MCI0671367.1 TIGR02757 family protein [Myxococcaceae bacterium]